MHRPHLNALALRAGIEPLYYTLTGERRETSDETAERLLTAIGLAVDTEEAAQRAIEEWDARLRAAVLEPVSVIEASPSCTLDLAATPHAAAAYHATLTLEDGQKLVFEGRMPESGGQDAVALALPAPLPLGYHALTCTLRQRDGADLSSEQRLIVVPTQCSAPLEGATGLAAQLYSVRGKTDAGVGDFGTLRELIDLASEMQLDFVALNPLCALDLEAHDVSPYAPTTRMALHPLYLDAQAQEKGGEKGTVLDSSIVPSQDHTAHLARSNYRGPSPFHARIDHKRVLASKLSAARMLEAGDLSQDDLRTTALWPTLMRYAVFAAIADHLRVRDFTQWPVELRDPSSAAVAAFADAHRERVAFHLALQLTLDQQLGASAQHARSAGLRMGLVSDLPVGSASGGSDTWAEPALFAHGVALGAPPDDYAPEGQSWGLAPIVPFRSQLDGHRFFSTLVQRAMRHAGGVRIDHVLGFIRQYWVPADHSGREGAYVRCPAQEWLGIVALESVRSGCVVLGEDLGTVPDGLREELGRRRMLRSHVLWFERDHDGRFRDPASYTKLSIASALTHDLPAFRELWDGRDLTRRHALGLLGSLDEAAAALERVRAERTRTRDALIGCLHDAGTLSRDTEATAEAMLRALYDWLARTPAVLLLALDDLALEPEGVNIPGTGPEVANWSRRMTRSLAELRSDDSLVTWVRALSSQRSLQSSAANQS